MPIATLIFVWLTRTSASALGGISPSIIHLIFSKILLFIVYYLLSSTLSTHKFILHVQFPNWDWFDGQRSPPPALPIGGVLSLSAKRTLFNKIFSWRDSFQIILTCLRLGMFRDIGTSQPQRWKSRAGEEHSKQAQFISTETPHEILSKRWGKSKRCAWEIHKTQSIGLLNLEIIVLWQITPVFVSSLLDIFELMCRKHLRTKWRKLPFLTKNTTATWK